MNVQGLDEMGVWGLGFRGLGFRVWGFGFRVWGLGFRAGCLEGSVEQDAWVVR